MIAKLPDFDIAESAANALANIAQSKRGMSDEMFLALKEIVADRHILYVDDGARKRAVNALVKYAQSEKEMLEKVRIALSEIWEGTSLEDDRTRRIVINAYLKIFSTQPEVLQESITVAQSVVSNPDDRLYLYFRKDAIDFLARIAQSHEPISAHAFHALKKLFLDSFSIDGINWNDEIKKCIIKSLIEIARSRVTISEQAFLVLKNASQISTQDLLSTNVTLSEDVKEYIIMALVEVARKSDAMSEEVLDILTERLQNSNASENAINALFKGLERIAEIDEEIFQKTLLVLIKIIEDPKRDIAVRKKAADTLRTINYSFKHVKTETINFLEKIIHASETDSLIIKEIAHALLMMANSFYQNADKVNPETIIKAIKITKNFIYHHENQKILIQLVDALGDIAIYNEIFCSAAIDVLTDILNKDELDLSVKESVLNALGKIVDCRKRLSDTAINALSQILKNTNFDLLKINAAIILIEILKTNQFPLFTAISLENIIETLENITDDINLDDRIRGSVGYYLGEIGHDVKTVHKATCILLNCDNKKEIFNCLYKIAKKNKENAKTIISYLLNTLQRTDLDKSTKKNNSFYVLAEFVTQIDLEVPPEAIELLFKTLHSIANNSLTLDLSAKESIAKALMAITKKQKMVDASILISLINLTENVVSNSVAEYGERGFIHKWPLINDLNEIVEKIDLLSISILERFFLMIVKNHYTKDWMINLLKTIPLHSLIKVVKNLDDLQLVIHICYLTQKPITKSVPINDLGKTTIDIEKLKPIDLHPRVTITTSLPFPFSFCSGLLASSSSGFSTESAQSFTSSSALSSSDPSSSSSSSSYPDGVYEKSSQNSNGISNPSQQTHIGKPSETNSRKAIVKKNTDKTGKSWLICETASDGACAQHAALGKQSPTGYFFQPEDGNSCREDFRHRLQANRGEHGFQNVSIRAAYFDQIRNNMRDTATAILGKMGSQATTSDADPFLSKNPFSEENGNIYVVFDVVASHLKPIIDWCIQENALIASKQVAIQPAVEHLNSMRTSTASSSSSSSSSWQQHFSEALTEGLTEQDPFSYLFLHPKEMEDRLQAIEKEIEINPPIQHEIAAIRDVLKTITPINEKLKAHDSALAELSAPIALNVIDNYLTCILKQNGSSWQYWFSHNEMIMIAHLYQTNIMIYERDNNGLLICRDGYNIQVSDSLETVHVFYNGVNHFERMERA